MFLLLRRSIWLCTQNCLFFSCHFHSHCYAPSDTQPVLYQRPKNYHIQMFLLKVAAAQIPVFPVTHRKVSRTDNVTGLLCGQQVVCSVGMTCLHFGTYKETPLFLRQSHPFSFSFYYVLATAYFS